jgi:hypothetical protein
MTLKFSSFCLGRNKVFLPQSTNDDAKKQLFLFTLQLSGFIKLKRVDWDVLSRDVLRQPI